MYKIRNKVYADAGYFLKGKYRSIIGYCLEGDLSDFTEDIISISDMIIKDGFAIYNNGKLREIFSPATTYEEYKARFVKKLFSNDDQIAIMLNKGNSEEDDMLFEKMQQWRDWCGKLAKAIVNLK